MSDAVDRAAEIMLDGDPGLSLVERLRAARALDNAGRLVSPEHDQAVAARALRDAAEDFATGAWHDAWMTDRVDDDVSAVRSTDKWLRHRADRIDPTEGEDDE